MEDQIFYCVNIETKGIDQGCGARAHAI